MAREIDSLQAKKYIKNGYFCVHKSGLLDFGRPWTPNSWRQVKIWGTSENLGVWRFKLAMWEVGGIKIERHEPDTFFLCVCTEIGEKVDLFVKCSVPGNFQQENFGGLVPTESLRTQDSENIVSLGDQAFVSKL